MSVSEHARQRFLAELAAHQIVAEQLEDGAYRIVVGDNTLTINLENKGREFDATGDETVLKHFVETILQHGTILPQSWDSVQNRLFFAAEPADHEFGDTCRQEVSDQVALVLVYLAEAGEHIVWMTPRQLGLVVFTYYAPKEQADSKETRSRLKMLDEMLPRALFQRQAAQKDEA